jgi:transcriptional regulator with XRE-family HTH domain
VTVKYHLNTDRLAALILSKRGSRGLREIASEIGDVSPSTLSRVENGKVPDLETFFSLCAWLGISPSLLIEGDRDSQQTTADAIAYQLRSDKTLDPVAANVLVVLIESAYQEFGVGDRP